MAAVPVVEEVERRVLPATAKVGPASATFLAPIEWRDVVQIRNYDTNHTLYRIPFGPARGQVVVRETGLMDWKLGKTVLDRKKRLEIFKEKAAKHGALLEANELARAISMAYKGVKGVVWIGGVPYPRKAIAQKRWREEHPELADWYERHVKPKMKGRPAPLETPRPLAGR